MAQRSPDKKIPRVGSPIPRNASLPWDRVVLSVVIPVFNERETLPKILSKVLLALRDIDKEIIIVDDDSNDGTRNWLVENIGVGRKISFLSVD